MIFDVFVAISCVFFVILLPNTVFVLLIALATFLAVAKPSAPVTEAAPVLASLLIVARFVDTFTALPSIVVEI